MSKNAKLNFEVFQSSGKEEFERLVERHYDLRSEFQEAYPWASGISLTEIAESVIPDSAGSWKTPIFCVISNHSAAIGIRNLLRNAVKYYEAKKKDGSFDILSISAQVKGDVITLKLLLRLYGAAPDVVGFFTSIGESVYKDENSHPETFGKIIPPKDATMLKISDNEIKKHDMAYEEQSKIYESSTDDVPFLNRIDRYIPKNMPKPEDTLSYIYDVASKEQSVNTVTSYINFKQVFSKIMNYVSGTEYYSYAQTLKENENPKKFMDFVMAYVNSEFVAKGILAEEDMSIMTEKIYNALFKLYIIQDFIDDPDITDINITAYNSIRVKIRGKMYNTNVSFVDNDDYIRFLNSICLRNHIPQDVSYIRFVDDYDERYKLRFSIASEYINSDNMPTLHIRKGPKHKMLANDLIKAGMFDEKIRDYIIEKGRTGSVLIAGPPGSGKTYFLNWFLEDAYEQWKQILVIQESDEIFAYRDGVVIHHLVLNPPKGMPSVSMEQLGQQALVEGVNAFIIGETKGKEIVYLMQLANSGCRTATSVHSDSAKAVVEKMVTLGMNTDSYTSPVQFKRDLAAFNTIVYLEDFKVSEITEIKGFDEKTGEIKLKAVYKRNLNR